jgi:signal transduction histidine kinase
MQISTQNVGERLWARLTAPHPSITDLEHRRQTRLLAIMLLTLGFMTLLAFGREIIVIAQGKPGQTTAAISTFVALLLNIPLFLLNNRGHYVTSARLSVTAVLLVVLLYSTTETQGAFFGTLVVLMATIFLTFQETVLASLVVIAVNFLWSLDHPVVSALFFNIFVATIVLAFLQYRTNLEADRQAELREKNDRLQKSELALQEKVVELERANKVKSAFLASMSHELRTPLNAVINFTKFVARGDLGPVNPEQTDALNEVIGSGKHLLNLINDVLDMSKIESGSLNLFIEDQVDLTAILNSVAITGKSLLAEKPVSLKVEIPPHLPLIRADRQRILQILLNIMSNACKFTKQGSITVTAQQEVDSVQIAISDTGPGIAPEDQNMVFEAFRQTETGLRQGGGTGLGMPISRSLVEAHGGRLWLQSEFGKGATFFVSLPIRSTHLVPLIDVMEAIK